MHAIPLYNNCLVVKFTLYNILNLQFIAEYSFYLAYNCYLAQAGDFIQWYFYCYLYRFLIF